ncbi:Retrotransposon gag protein, partial [Metarhizium majus ARSEF 297]
MKRGEEPQTAIKTTKRVIAMTGRKGPNGSRGRGDAFVRRIARDATAQRFEQEARKVGLEIEASRELSRLKQTGTVAEYVSQFQQIAERANLPETSLRDTFHDGLTGEIRERLRWRDESPNYLANAIALEMGDPEKEKKVHDMPEEYRIQGEPDFDGDMLAPMIFGGG